jgi:hypothetical protein
VGGEKGNESGSFVQSDRESAAQQSREFGELRTILMTPHLLRTHPPHLEQRGSIRGEGGSRQRRF